MTAGQWILRTTIKRGPLLAAFLFTIILLSIVGFSQRSPLPRLLLSSLLWQGLGWLVQRRAAYPFLRLFVQTLGLTISLLPQSEVLCAYTVSCPHSCCWEPF